MSHNREAHEWALVELICREAPVEDPVQISEAVMAEHMEKSKHKLLTGQGYEGLWM